MGRAVLSNMDSGNLEGMKLRGQDQGKVVGMRKESSFFGKEVYCGAARTSIIWIKMENTLIKFVHATNLGGVANMIDNRIKIQEVMLERGNGELKQTE